MCYLFIPSCSTMVFCVCFCTFLLCPHGTFSPFSLHPPTNIHTLFKGQLKCHSLWEIDCSVGINHIFHYIPIPLCFSLSYNYFLLLCVLFMSVTHPRDTSMHTLCCKLLKDSHPTYPSTRTSICSTHYRCLMNVNWMIHLQGLVKIVSKPSTLRWLTNLYPQSGPPLYCSWLIYSITCYLQMDF